MRSDRHHFDALGLRVVLHPVANLHTIQTVGRGDVEDDKVGLETPDLQTGVIAVFRGHDAEDGTIASQGARDHFQSFLLIVDHEDLLSL